MSRLVVLHPWNSFKNAKNANHGFLCFFSFLLLSYYGAKLELLGWEGGQMIFRSDEVLVYVASQMWLGTLNRTENEKELELSESICLILFI